MFGSFRLGARIFDLREKYNISMELVQDGRKRYARYRLVSESATTNEMTLQDLKNMAPGTVFAHGIIENSPEGIYMTETRRGDKLIWAAKRGRIHDWAIYIHWAESGLPYAIDHGDKVSTEGNIKKLVPCDDEAFGVYRF